MNLTDPTGHYACGDGIDDPRCDQKEQPDIPNPPEPPVPPVGESDNYYLCVGQYCAWSDSYGEWWLNEHLPNIPNYTGQTVSQISELAEQTVDPFLDVRGAWTGLKTSGKVGFGIDGIIQGGKDLKRNDLNLAQRFGRGIAVGAEGYATGALSVSLADGAVLLTVTPATTIAVGTEQLWVAPVMIGGAWVLTYAAVNVTLSTAFDRFNSGVFPSIGLGDY